MDNNDAVKKFVSGNTISIKMQVTPEEYRVHREWSLSIPTFYMLDICVVSTTKLNENSLEKNPRKANLVNFLRELDRPQNCFSYLCALMEKVSDSRGLDTDEELESKILSDLKAMRDFFKHARVYESDEIALNYLKTLRGAPIEESRADYLGFLMYLNDQLKLGNPVSSKHRLDIAKKIIEQTENFSFSRQHPIVVIALSCLYGNHAAKKMMKFKARPQDFDSENVLADIMLINRFASIKLEIEQLARDGVCQYLRTLFITDDNGLTEIFKCFTPDVVKHIDTCNGRETKTTMTVNLKDLLTDIEIEEYDYLLNLLNQG